MKQNYLRLSLSLKTEQFETTPKTSSTESQKTKNSGEEPLGEFSQYLTHWVAFFSAKMLYLVANIISICYRAQND